jgi:hypothetical protein
VAAASTSGDEPSNRMATYTADPAPAAASAVAEPAPPAHASAGGEDDTFSRWLAAGGVAALAAGVAVLLMRRHAGMGIDDRGGGFHPAPPPPPPLQAGAPPRAAEPEMPPGRRTRVGEYDFTPPAPRRPAALLQWRAGPRAGRAVGIEASRLTIGSDPSCDLALVDDDFVSGLHAEIRYEAGSLYLTDRESRNGTFLNGERMTALPRPLQRGDELRIGTTVLRLLDPSGTTPAVAGHDEGAVR